METLMNLLALKCHPMIHRITEDGPYYTSYPVLGAWDESYNSEDYERDLKAWLPEKKPLHLYLHIPFCAKLCYYCVCNIVVSNNREKIQHFLDYMLREIDLLRSFMDGEANFREIHFGGGTPSHLYNDQFAQLCQKLEKLTGPLKSLDEVSMEIDPRTTTRENLAYFASLGVTRISFGVQDFNPAVQEAINRVQPPELIDALLTPDIRRLFTGVNFDLLYGLPKQTLDTFRDTVQTTIRMRPERVTLLKYAHAPEVRKHMRMIKESDLPHAQDLPTMFLEAAQAFIDAGYVWVGLDHFALPTDDLSIAYKEGKVHRTFNGFAPGRTKDMVGIGPTTTGAFGRYYAQTTYDFDEYYKAIDAGRFPIIRGYRLTDQDLSEREAIFGILCRNELGGQPMTPMERLLSRQICQRFDSHPMTKYRMGQKQIVHKIKAVA